MVKFSTIALLLCLGLPCLATQAATRQDLAQQGRQIFDDTPRHAAAYVGNKLACNSCHLGGGTVAYASPMTGLARRFPQFSKRAGRVISLQTRIQECFVRSEAGQPPPANSRVMQALVAYIDSLSTDTARDKAPPGRGLVKLAPLDGNPQRGAALYAAQCALCHGADGGGTPPALPPLWGPDSFNDGAGMHKPDKMAAFVIHNMPQNRPGSLTPQQAYDIAAFIHTKPRPRFNPVYARY